jgi:large conductance mechanosensitive channel
VLKGFKDFLMRGNVVELAVAVVIGTAFTAIVTAFTDGLIQPLINAIGGSGATKGLGFTLVNGNPATFVNLGEVINAAINFVLIAAIVYFAFILPMQKLQARRDRGQEAGPAQPTDVELLAEIRDLMRQERIDN